LDNSLLCHSALDAESRIYLNLDKLDSPIKSGNDRKIELFNGLYLMLKRFLKKILPKKLINFYHFCLAHFAARFYDYPARKMIVIGVTGTKGKSSVCYLIAKILEEAGERVGMTSTIFFKIGAREWLNDKKMTMLGRFGLQKMLWKMHRAGCAYAIVETSSEGIAQFRNVGIDYDVAVFTNLTPEHIESHGSFEAYAAAKEKLFKNLKIYNLSKKIRGEIIPKIFIVNSGDRHADKFLSYPADRKFCFKIEAALTPHFDSRSESTPSDPAPEPSARYGAGATSPTPSLPLEKKGGKEGKGGGYCDEEYLAENVELGRNYSFFVVKIGESEESVKLNLIGEVNVLNALAAISCGLALGIPFRFIKTALEKIKIIPGRFEVVVKEPFTLIVDYAHEPASFRELYKTANPIRNRDSNGASLLPKNRIIHVFGATGGGRDGQKAPEMGRIAAANADIIILTTDDPYFDNPQILSQNILNGILDYTKENPERRNIKVLQVIDRKEAIRVAIETAKPGDLVLLTGKGSEQAMVVGEKLIHWDDREVVRQILNSK